MSDFYMDGMGGMGGMGGILYSYGPNFLTWVVAF